MPETIGIRPEPTPAASETHRESPNLPVNYGERRNQFSPKTNLAAGKQKDLKKVIAPVQKKIVMIPGGKHFFLKSPKRK
jgi:hypothetical protein